MSIKVLLKLMPFPLSDIRVTFPPSPVERGEVMGIHGEVYFSSWCGNEVEY